MTRHPSLIKALVTVVTLALAAASAILCVAAPASAAPTSATPSPVGLVAGARQDTFNHRLLVWGWAYDQSHRNAAIVVRAYADGHYVGQIRTTVATPNLNAHHGLTGKHGFRLSVPYTPTATTVKIGSVGASTSTAVRSLGQYSSAKVTHTQPAAGARIITVAKRYVGHARYVEGGASPKSGFDCSGYTKYAYAIAKVATLPHNADSQRRMTHMHAVSAARAQPGDLVFYLSGGSAYHVAIYAGHGMQYAAATPRDGIRYQHVWSSAVQYRHYS